MFTKHLCTAAVLLVLLQLFNPPGSEAQENEKWHFAVPVYLWGAGLNGTVGVLGRTAEVDQSFSDLLSNLHFGFMGGSRAYKNQWAITTELIYMKVGSATSTGTDVDVDQWIVAGDVGYQVAPSVEVLGGARIVSLGNSIDFQAPLLPTLHEKKTWVDPLIGVRFAPRLSESWSLWTRFDLGGFGIGSKFTWQINANAVYSFSEKTALAFGYRVIHIDYEDDNTVSRFKLDAATHGPIAGLVFSF